MTDFVGIALLALLVVVATAVLLSRNLFGIVILSGIFSLTTAVLFLSMDAPDVAFTEAAVGVGFATVLMLAALAMVGHQEKAPQQRGFLPLVVVTITGAILIYGVVDIPPFGDPDNPIHHHVVPRYLTDVREEVDVDNTVSAVLASYRGYDTLGETAVIMAAGIGVLLMLSGVRRRFGRGSMPTDPKEGAKGPP